MADDDEKRAANEAAFREANEHIRAAQEELEAPVERVPFLCECDDVRCRAVITLTADEYEGIRADATLFVVLPGHSSGGELVEEHGRYVVVRKTGGEEEVVRALDPRKEER